MLALALFAAGCDGGASDGCPAEAAALRASIDEAAAEVASRADTRVLARAEDLEPLVSDQGAMPDGRAPILVVRREAIELLAPPSHQRQDGPLDEYLGVYVRDALRADDRRAPEGAPRPLYVQVDARVSARDLRSLVAPIAGERELRLVSHRPEHLEPVAPPAWLAAMRAEARGAVRGIHREPSASPLRGEAAARLAGPCTAARAPAARLVAPLLGQSTELDPTPIPDALIDAVAGCACGAVNANELREVYRAWLDDDGRMEGRWRALRFPASVDGELTALDLLARIDAGEGRPLEPSVAHAPPVSAPTSGRGATVSRDAIRGVIQRHRDAVRACYEARLYERPALEGRVTLLFTIAPDGGVSAARVSEIGALDALLERCLVREAGAWFFPPPEDGGLVQVAYPFDFRVAD